VSVIYDGVNMTLSLDGAQMDQTSVPSSPAASGNPLVIGGGFYGSIQGFRAWSGAVNVNVLSDNQWTDFPSGTAGLLTQLDFTVSPPADSSGQQITPAFAGSFSYVPFVPCGVFETSAFADTYNDGLVNPGGSASPFSINAWVCPQSLGSPMYIFTNGVAESSSGVTLGVNAAGNVELQAGASPVLTSQAVLTAGTWVNIAATWSDNVGTLYVNGVQDNSASNMTLGSTLATGEPLVGAIASVGAKLPISSFQGFIQNVNVWNIALTAAQVAQYMTSSLQSVPNPQSDPNCVGAYDFSGPPAQNLVSLNPTGLVAGAALVSCPVTMNAVLAFQQVVSRPASLSSAPHAGQPIPSGPQAVTLSSMGFLQQQLRDFDGFLGTMPLSALQRATFRAQFEAKLRQGQMDFVSGRLKNHLQCRIDQLPNGVNRLVHLAADGEHVVYEGALSDCQLWCIQLVAAVLAALYTAFGFALNYSKWLNGFTTFFGTRINSIGIMPQLAALFRNGVSANNIQQAVQLLQEYSLLVPLAKLSWSLLSASVSWWTVLSVGMRILLIVSPAAPLEVAWFVAQLAYSIYAIQQVVSARPGNCPGSSVAIRLPPRSAQAQPLVPSLA
jgi:hypothetical protein